MLSSHGSGRSRKRAAQISIGIRPACGTSGMVSLIVLIGRVEMLRAYAATLTAKKFDLLREIVPQATDIGLLVNPTGALAKMEIKEMSEATQRLGQHLHIANVSNEDEINTAMAGDAHRCLSQCWITRRRCGPN